MLCVLEGSDKQSFVLWHCQGCGRSCCVSLLKKGRGRLGRTCGNAYIANEGEKLLDPIVVAWNLIACFIHSHGPSCRVQASCRLGMRSHVVYSACLLYMVGCVGGTIIGFGRGYCPANAQVRGKKKQNPGKSHDSNHSSLRSHTHYALGNKFVLSS